MHTISTPAPREGSDQLVGSRVDGEATFQPPLPARGATEFDAMERKTDEISTPAPREGSDIKFNQIHLRHFSQNAHHHIQFNQTPSIFLPNRAQDYLPGRLRTPFFGANLPWGMCLLGLRTYKMSGSSGIYVCLQPKCSILFSYRLPR